MTSLTQWYQIQVIDDSKLPMANSSQALTIFVGPYTYISGQKNAVRLSQKSIAEVFCHAMQRIFETRHRETIKLIVVSFSAELNEKQQRTVSLHDAIIRERLETANFSPNKKVNLNTRRNFN